MKKTLLAFAAAASVVTLATVAMPDKAEAQVFVYQGARYCFYVDGWHGPGWYRCGYRLRTGLGWGGAYGWHGWRHAGWERRHHGRGGDVNVRIRSGDRDGMRNRTTTTTRERSTIRSGANGRGGSEMRGTTGVNTNRSGGPMMRGGGPSGGSQPSASPSGGASGGGGGGGGAGTGAGGGAGNP